jgi:hypothetical protein
LEITNTIPEQKYFLLDYHHNSTRYGNKYAPTHI